jgi:bifunctional lysine-specific demethylase and histidyl-hydroxylase NO66
MLEAEAMTWMLEPLSLTEFVEEYWERSICHIARDERARFDSLISLSEIERGLLTGQFNRATLRLSRETSVDTKSYFVTRRYSPNKTAAQELDPERVMDEFARGATLVLTFAETIFDRVSALSRATAAVFSSVTEGHVIVTPASADKPALKTHYDIVDVFALQVTGRKRWKIYQPQFVSPLPSQRNIGVGALAEHNLIADIEVGPGDTLYVPRGFPHFAELIEGPSMHVAIGVRPFTVYDAIAQSIEAALARLSENPDFRRALFEPRLVDHTRTDEALLHAVEEGLATLRDQIEPALGLARLRQQLRQNQHCISTGRLAALAFLDSMSADSLVAVGDRSVLSPVSGPGSRPAWRLEANNRALLLPPMFESALRQLTNAPEPLRLRDLEGLDGDNGILLGKLLVRNGVGVWLNPPV